MLFTKLSISLRNGRIKQNVPFLDIFFFKIQSNINTDTKERLDCSH